VISPAPIIALVGPRTGAEVASCFAATEVALTETEREWLALARERRE